MSVEAALKKVGFDVIGLSSEYAMAEQMLAFNPDLVVGSGKGGKVSSLGVGKRLKEMTRWAGKIVLIFPANFKPNPQELIKIRVDMVLESPVAPVRLIQVIGHMLGHDEAVLLDRLNKAMHVETPQKSTTAVGGGGKVSPEGEAIYVTGSVKDGETGDGERGLVSERVENESEETTLTTDEQKEKISFRFGDRTSESTHSSEQLLEGASEAFPDVDLTALEKELLGGGAPEVERVEDAASSEEEELQIRAKESLIKSEQVLKDKMARYAKQVENVNLPPKSSLTRVEARRRQKALEADWDSQNLSELDKLRQEFTKGLFKK